MRSTTAARWLMLLFFSSVAHAGGPIGSAIQGTLYSPVGAPVTSLDVDFTIEVYDKSKSCLLYQETHSGVDLSTTRGAFSLELGKGDSRSNKIDNSNNLTLDIFRNDSSPLIVNGCNSPVAFADGDERYIRVKFVVDASGTSPTGPVTLEPDLKIGSTPFASIAATLNGKAASDFVQVRNDSNFLLSQSNLEFAFSSTNYPRLQSLLLGGQTLSNIGAPAASTDAVNKSYADNNIGGKSIDLSSIGPAIGNGRVLTWDATAGKWVASEPSTGITALTGDITASGAGSVVASITADAVTNTKIANGAITASKIDSGYAINRLVITDGTTGSNLTYSVCPNVNEVLKWTTNGWQCANLATFAPVTSVAGKTGNISLNINDVDGLGTAAGRSVGTANGNVIEVTGSGLPALDGAQLTNVNATRLQSRTIASTSPNSGQVLMWNGSQWEPSTPASASGTSTGVFLADNGTVTAPSIAFSSETGTGFYKRVAGQVAFTANGSDGFLFTNGAISSPIPGGAQIMTSGGTPSNPAYRFVGENTTGMYSPSTGTLAFSTVSTERLRINAAGNVGIGTTLPTARLHLTGGGAGPNGAALKITEGNLLTNPEAGAIEFDGTSLYFTDTATNRHMLWAGVDTSKAGDYYSGITYTTSDGGTPYDTCLNPTETLMNSGQMTDIGTWGSTGETNSWIQADLGSSKPVVGIVVGGAGPLTCWGDSPTSYWNSAGSNIKIQTSLDGSSWTEVANGSAISYTHSPQALTFTMTTARYVRIFLANGWLATGSFRILAKAPVVSGQWASSGNSLLYNGNAVAIGTASPNGTLTVGGAGFGMVNSFPSLLTLAATSSDPWALSFTRTDLGPNSSVSLFNRGDATSGRFSVAVGDGNGGNVTPFEIDKTKSVFRGNVDVNGAIKSLQSINIYVDTNRADDTGDGFTAGTAKKTLGAALNLADSLTTSRVTILIANSSSGNRARMGSTGALTNKTIQISANQQATCYIDWDAGLRVDNVSLRLGLLGWETGCNILVNTPYMFVTDSGFFHLILNQGGNSIRFNGDNQSLFYERYLNHVAGNIRIIGDSFNPGASTITGSGVNGSRIISDNYSGQNVYVEGNVASNFIDSSVNASGVYYEKNISSLASGNVGIGTISPSARLEISSGSAGVSGLKFANFNSSTATSTGQAVGVDGSGNLVTIGSGGGGVTYPLTGSAGSVSAPTYSFTGDTDTGWFSPGAGSMAASTNSTERIRIDSTGNVGIGTLSPTARIEIKSGSAGVSGLKFSDFNSSTSTSTGQAVGVDASGNLVTVAAPGTSFPLTGSLGSAAAPTYSYTGDTDTGWFSPTAGTIAASTNGTERLRVSSFGYLGIGTADPIDSIHAHNANNVGMTLRFTNLTTGATSSDGSSVGIAGNGNFYIWNNEASPLSLGTNNLERLVIDSNGNVGINSSVPAVRFDVNGVANVKRIDSNQTDSALYTGTSASANPDGALNYFTNTSTATGTASHINWQSGTTQRAYMGIVRSPSGNAPSIVIGQQTAASQTSERLRIDANGNVGIGTASPSAKLEVTSGTNGVSGLKFTNFNSSSATSTGQAVGVDASGNLVTIAGGSTTFPLNGSLGSAAIPTYSFSGDTDTGWFSPGAGILAASINSTERMRIDASGNVGIGSATPTQALDVNGKIAVSGTQTLYNANSTYTGSIFVGNGGASLAHTFGNEGYYNTGVGLGALTGVTTGFRNTAFGYQAGKALTTSYGNTALGYNALSATTTSPQNTAVGDQALAANTTSNNTAVGYTALAATTTGQQNTAVGSIAMAVNTLGFYNTAVGYSALNSNTSGNTNAAFAMQSLQNNTTGSYNSAFGYQSLSQNTTGGYNSALGYKAGGYLADGSTGNATASNSVYLGFDTRASAAGQTNETVIGSGAIGLGSNTVVLGSTSVVTTALRGNVGIGTTSPSAKLEVSSGTAGASGLKFTNFNASSATSTGQAVGVDASGNLVTIAAGSSLSQVTAGAGLTGGGSSGNVTLNVDIGTTASKILQLDASARIPAVDGGLLTNLSAQRLQGRTLASTAPTANQVLSWNNGTSQWEPSTTAGITYPLSGSLGSVCAVTYGFSGDGDTGVYSPGDGNFSVAANCQERMRINNGDIYFNGNVGIGSTVPTQKLDVAGQMIASGKITSSTSLQAPLINTFSPTSLQLGANGSYPLLVSSTGAGIGGTTGASLAVVQTTGTAGDLLHLRDSPDSEDLVIRYNGTNGFLFQSELIGAGSNILTLFTNGNVGIGTTSPSRLLHVNGPMRITASALPGTPATGDVAVDSGDSNKLKWYDGSGWQAAGGSGGGGFAGAVNMSSTPYTITSSDSGKAFYYSNNANGVVNLPALSGVSDGFSVTIHRQVAKTLTITPNGSDKFPGGVSTIEMQGKNLQSVTVMKLGSVWALNNQTDECTVGRNCWTEDSTGGMSQIYVGTYKGHQYFTTPGGCTNSGTPTCAGGTDTVTKIWSSSATTSGTTAGNTATVLGTNTENSYSDATVACSNCGGTGMAEYLGTAFTDTAAAAFCTNMNYAGYTDWYLPSKEELGFLYRNSQTIGGFVYSSYYWSSDENNSTNAWDLHLQQWYRE